MIEWRVIEEFPLYEISNTGTLRSWKKKERAWRNPDASPGRRDTPVELSGTQTAKGYTAFTLRGEDGKPTRRLCHRLVALAFLGPPPTLNHTDVAHNDGNPGNNKVENLRWATHRDNQLDMFKHGTTKSGEKSITCKITKSQAVEIRDRVAKEGRGSQALISKELGLSKAQVSRIVNKTRWRHID